MQRKAAQADAMFAALVAQMTAAETIARAQAFTVEQETPAWL
jgi:hypothetical protein